MAAINELYWAGVKKPGGFTAIEGIIAVFILSFVGLVIGLTWLHTSVAAVNTRQTQRATALAAMVSEQYAAYAAHDFANLASYDQRNTAPQAFFGTKDDLGYDNLRITTSARPDPSGRANVVIRISWTEGGHTQFTELQKTFAESAGDAGNEGLSGI